MKFRILGSLFVLLILLALYAVFSGGSSSEGEQDGVVVQMQ